MNEKKETTLMTKVYHTVVLTLVSALILGFFGLIGWMAKTLSDISSTMEVVKENQNITVTTGEKQLEVYNKIIFDLKKKVHELESNQEELLLLKDDIELGVDSFKKMEELAKRKEFEKNYEKNEDFRKFDNDLRQQIQQNVAPKMWKE